MPSTVYTVTRSNHGSDPTANGGSEPTLLQRQLDLLNSIDKFRFVGINHHVPLPQVIVCGDQTAGKSAVLEAVSGVSFPVQCNTCTRLPTELILRRMPQSSSTVSIVPDASRTEAEKLSLCEFREDLEGFDGLGKITEAAKTAMEIHA